MDRQKIKRCFSQGSSSYDEQAAIHKISMNSFLLAIQTQKLEPALILDVGCGTGLHFQSIKQAFPNALLQACDHSEAMIAKAQKQNLAGECFTCDALSITGSFDLIMSHFSLHWMHPVHDVFNHWIKNAHYVAICVPLDGSFSAWQELLGTQSSLMPLPKESDFLAYHERMISYDVLDYPMVFSTPLEFARYLKSLGAHYSPSQQFKILKDPKWHQGPFKTSYKVLQIILKGDL